MQHTKSAGKTVEKQPEPPLTGFPESPFEEGSWEPGDAVRTLDVE